MFRKIISILLTVTIITSAFTTMITTVNATEKSTDAIADVAENAIDINGNNSFGNMLSSELDDAMSVAGSEGDHAINNLEVSGQLATVEYQSSTDCTILVALYDDETNRMIASGKALAVADTDKVEIEIQNDVMPQYFVAKAYMLDENNNPIANSFTTNLYTKAIQELKALKVSDFDENRVVNLDDSDETNFAVYSESTKVVEYKENCNIPVTVDDENGLYVFSNATEEFISLEKGDVVSYEYSDDTIIIIKVDSITVEGDTVTITESEAEIEDVFDYIKIEATQDTSDCEVDMSKADDDVKLADNSVSAPVPGLVRASQGGVTVKSKDLKFQLFENGNSNLSVSGDVTLSIEAKIEYYFSFEKVYVDFSLGYSVDYKVALTVKLKDRIEKELGGVTFRPIAVLAISLTPKVVFEAEASISMSLKSEGKVGVRVIDGKANNNSKAPTSSTQIKAKGRMFVGIALEPSVSIISKKVFKLAFDATCGLCIEAENNDPDPKHRCEICFKGVIGAELIVGFDIEIFAKEIGRIEGKIKIELFKFYYSVDYNDVGIGDCPYNVDNTEPTEATESTTPTESTSPTSPTGDTDVTEPDEGPKVLYSGKAGKTSTWELFDNGVLNINGTGELSNPNWYNYKDLIKLVNIEDGITSIDSYAFRSCHNLTNINIPDSVTVIKECAFYDCTALKKIVIPDNVTKIGRGAFSSCSSLSDIHIPDSVIDIGSGAFSGTEYYNNSENWENYVLYIGNHLIEAKKTIWGTYTVKENVVCIADSAFISCTGLSTVVLPDTLKSVGVCAFTRCENLKNIEIPEGVVKIAESAFSGCVNITSIVIPDSVIDMGSGVFRECSSLADVKIGDGVKRLNSYAFASCLSLKTITIPVSVNSISSLVFQDCSNLETVIILEGVTYIGADAFSNCTKLSSISIPDTVQSISGRAFYNCKSLNNIKIPDSVTFIGASAFDSCSGLTSFTIPKNVTTIEANTFKNCVRITEITIPDNITSIGNSAFYNCIRLTSVKIAGSVKNIGEKAFYQCSGLTDVAIGNGVEVIDTFAFFECTSIQKISIPASVSVINSDAFCYCNNLTDVYIYGTPAIKTSSFPKTATLHYVENIVNSVSAPNLTSTFVGESSVITADISKLVAGEDYIIAVVKNENCEDVLSADNLLYIDQLTADDNGKISLDYLPRENTESYSTLIFGAQMSISYAKVSACVDTNSQTVGYVVTLNDEVLVENVDYKLEVNFENSTVMITGINRFKDSFTSSVGILRIGDVNMDGVIDVSDSSYLMKCTVGLKKFTETQRLVSDVNDDGFINVMDATAIQKYIVGLVQKLG